MPYKNIRRGIYRARSAMGTDSFNILAIGIVAGSKPACLRRTNCIIM